MDLITQGVIGAAAAQCGARPNRLRIAALAGAIGGLFPDSDVLMRIPSDPLFNLEYHRHFTHSLLFIPVGAGLAALLTWWVTRKREKLSSLWWPSFLGITTHGLLDSCTSYGTRLYWPFSDARVAWHLVSILDPLFTLALAIGVVVAIWKGSRLAARMGFGVAMAYLALCGVQKQRVQAVHAALIADRGHQGIDPQVKPAIASNILYRTFYTHDGHYYVDAIRVSWFGSSKVYQGDYVPVLDLEKYVSTHSLDALQQSDIARFNVFSAGYLIEDPRSHGVLSDFRYAALPNAIAPLWGIDVLGTPAGEHLEFHRWSALDEDDKSRFKDMMFGR